jgi:hypothetical protein
MAMNNIVFFMQSESNWGGSVLFTASNVNKPTEKHLSYKSLVFLALKKRVEDEKV